MKMYLPTALLLFTMFHAAAQYAPGSRRIYTKSYSRMTKAERNHYRRSYFGITLPVNTLNFSASIYSSDESIPNSTEDQKVNWPTRSSLKPGMKSSLGLVSGSFGKLVTTDRTSMIGLDYGTAVDVNTYKLDPLPFATSMGEADNFITMVFRVPVILVYKTGGEVTMKKKDRTFFSIGAGAVPTGLFCGFRDLATASFALQSVVMVEGGGLAGIGMKLRLSYYPSTSVYFDKKEEITDGTYTQRATLVAFTGGTFAVSAIVLTGTSRWSKNKW